MVLANAHHLIGFGEFLVPVKYTSKLQLPAESRCFTLPPLLHDEQPLSSRATSLPQDCKHLVGVSCS